MRQESTQIPEKDTRETALLLGTRADAVRVRLSCKKEKPYLGGHEIKARMFASVAGWSPEGSDSTRLKR